MELLKLKIQLTNITNANEKTNNTIGCSFHVNSYPSAYHLYRTSVLDVHQALQ